MVEVALMISDEKQRGQIRFQEAHQFFRAFGLLLDKLQQNATKVDIHETQQFQTVGPMFDVSRNSQVNESSFQELVRIMAVMGFNSAMIYMEDVYEVDEIGRAS